MDKRVTKYEAQLIDMIREDGWPLFRVLDEALSEFPGYDHVPMRPGPLDEERIAQFRSVVHTLMH